MDLHGAIKIWIFAEHVCVWLCNDWPCMDLARTAPASTTPRMSCMGCAAAGTPRDERGACLPIDADSRAARCACRQHPEADGTSAARAFFFWPRLRRAYAGLNFIISTAGRQHDQSYMRRVPFDRRRRRALWIRQTSIQIRLRSDQIESDQTLQLWQKRLGAKNRGHRTTAVRRRPPPAAAGWAGRWGGGFFGGGGVASGVAKERQRFFQVLDYQSKSATQSKISLY
jgi:hypothetical protein